MDADDKFRIAFLTRFLGFFLCIIITLGVIEVTKATHNPSAVTKAIRSGSITLTNTDLTKAVTFATAMPSANYTCVFERTGVVATVVSTSSKGTSGFTANISIGITETPKYLCVED